VTVGRIRVDGVSKRFQLRRDRADSVGQLLVRMLPGRRPPPAEPFWALRDVSLEMAEGRSLGVIGHNGAGKSTLLKILTHTMQPTTGSVLVRGRTSALIELGAGFHPDFTGRENIVLNASILGIPRREIERRMTEIVEFSGIAPFIDSPVKYYSSGMYARLGFSVAIHVDPEILIVDEVLAVGDQAFNERCMARILQMKRSGVGILLVTHGLDAVENLMDDAVWLDHGRVRAAGSPRDVVHAYRSHTASPPQESSASTAPDDRAVGNGLVRVAGVEVTAQEQTRDLNILRTAEPARCQLLADNAGPEALPVHARIVIRRPDGLEVADLTTRARGIPLVLPPGRTTFVVHIDALLLAPGRYEVDAQLLSAEGILLHETTRAAVFQVRATIGHQGVCVLPHHWGVA
jgi:ABC-type polysaccharide/polyol phosphate transport system ATPase subunit